MNALNSQDRKNKMYGPQTEFSESLHAEKYRGQGESFREAMNRVANALKDDHDHFHALRDILLDMRFMPAGRIQNAMGSTRQTTPYNCFVSGTIEDSFINGHGSIMSRATEAAGTMRLGGGIGYDFSTLRPRGATIRKLQSRSSGPISFMQIYDAVCRCVASSGHRRGAQMAVLRVDHPDIEEFIHAKQNSHNLTGFNISVGITDNFMMAVEEDNDFDLVFEGQVYKTVRARALWEMLMRSSWDWAEPGVLFLDTINRMNNLYYCEKIAATNPCGEQPLPPYGACLLGSFNLVKYIKTGDDGKRFFDMAQFHADIPVVVRALDNVVDRATYPLYEQEKEAKSKRRMGLGITGLANAVEAMGLPYGDFGFCEMTSTILKELRDEAYRASAMLAAEKGSFQLYKRADYLESQFVAGLPEDILALIGRNGIRNSHLTSIAPTGTISLCADNVSSGIEPVFGYSVSRTLMAFDGEKQVSVDDYGLANFGVQGRRAQDVTVEQHMAVVAAAVPYVDSAISKTCNVPPNTPWEEFKDIYFKAWKMGAKGCTTFQVEGKRMGILKTKDDDAPQACFVNPETGERSCE